MDAIITYDTKRNHTEIKTVFKSIGFKDIIAGFVRRTTTRVVPQLPSTTLLKYGVLNNESVLHQVLDIIIKYHGSLNAIFSGQLAAE